MNIIKLAKEAGLFVHDRKNQVRVGMDVLTGEDSTPALERFAALVRAERKWVDLTDDEIDEIESKILMAGGEHNDIYRAVIAADREKNRG